MIAQNEIKVPGELANKADNLIVSHKHHNGRISVQMSVQNNDTCTIIPFPPVEVKHI